MDIAEYTEQVNWLKSSKYKREANVAHMFWVDASDYARWNGEDSTIGSFCRDLYFSQRGRQYKLGDWVCHSQHHGGRHVYIFTKMPKFEEYPFDERQWPIEKEHVEYIKELLKEYNQEDDGFFQLKEPIKATDCLLSWKFASTGLQWATFSLLQGGFKNYADFLNELEYAGYTDWRTPSVTELRGLISCDLYSRDWASHPLAEVMPKAVIIPLEYPASVGFMACYLIEEEKTLRSEPCSAKKNCNCIDCIRNSPLLNIGVRGELKVKRSFQTGWCGVLYDWTESSMSIHERGDLPASKKAWLNLNKLTISGKSLAVENINFVSQALENLIGLSVLNINLDEHFNEIPDFVYGLTWLKELNVSKVLAYSPGGNVNLVTSVSSQIKNLKLLESLKIHSFGKGISCLPDEVFRLINLKYFSIASNSLVFSRKQFEHIVRAARTGVFYVFNNVSFKNYHDTPEFFEVLDSLGDDIHIGKVVEILNSITDKQPKVIPNYVQRRLDAKKRNAVIRT